MTDDPRLSEDLNCAVCWKRGWYRARGCYKFFDTQQIVIPTFKNGWGEKSGETTLADVESFWESYFAVERAQPDADPLAICELLGVCPEGLIDKDVAQYLSDEGMCSEYKCPPVEGGLGQWPHHTATAFKVIRNTNKLVQHERHLARMAKIPGG